MGKLKILPISIRISERDLSVFTGVLGQWGSKSDFAYLHTVGFSDRRYA